MKPKRTLGKSKIINGLAGQAYPTHMTLTECRWKGFCRDVRKRMVNYGHNAMESAATFAAEKHTIGYWFGKTLV